MSDTRSNDILIRKLCVKMSKNYAPTKEDLHFIRSKSPIFVDKYAINDLFCCFRILSDPMDAAFIDPYLQMKTPRIVALALWTLCWIGAGDRYKSYILAAVEPGFPWDESGDAAGGALTAAGYHLKTHHDRDFAQLIARWATRKETCEDRIDTIISDAQMAAGYAVGADPARLADDDEEYTAASLARFLAERQDG
jgi:hypothetical protein